MAVTAMSGVTVSAHSLTLAVLCRFLTDGGEVVLHKTVSLPPHSVTEHRETAHTVHCHLKRMTHTTWEGQKHTFEFQTDREPWHRLVSAPDPKPTSVWIAPTTTCGVLYWKQYMCPMRSGDETRHRCIRF